METSREDETSRCERLREMLLEKRAEIEARIREELGEKLTEDLDSALGQPADLGDLSSVNLEQDVDYELLNMRTAMLKEIDETLEQLDEGTYGICEECGEEIGEKRLQAVPFAHNCIDCQREKEKLFQTNNGSLWTKRRAQIGQDRTGADEYP